MFNKVLLTVLFIFCMLFSSVHGVATAAEWSSMNPGVTNDFYSVWGSSSNDIYAVGTLGKNLHYDGNPEGIWEDQGKNSG